VTPPLSASDRVGPFSPPSTGTAATAPGTDDGPSVVNVRRFALVEFDGPGRRVRRVVTMFASLMSAELFAVEQGLTEFIVAPASILVSLRE
jgi:hypothetical protein